MADNTTLPTSDGGGDNIRTEDHGGGGIKTPISLIDVGGTGATEAILGDSSVVFPLANTVKDASGTFYAPLVDSDGHLQVDCLSCVVTNAGTFAVQVDGSALTALQLIDDFIYADDADWTALTSKHGLVGGVYQSTPGTITDGDTGPIRLTANGAVHISDAGGSVTVDNGGTFAVQAAQSGTWNVTNISGTVSLPTGASTAANQSTANTALSAIQTAVEGTLTVGSHAVTNAGTFATQVDGAALTALQLIDNGVYVDDADWTATSSSHYLVGGVYQSTPGTVTDGDVGPFRINSNGALHVSIQEGGGTGGTSETDDGAFTAGSGSGTPVMGFFSTDTVDAGDVGVLAMDASRRLLVSIEADNVGIGGGTQYTEDAAAPANPVGNAMMAERDDALGGLTPIEGDWSHLFCNANGALWVKPDGDVTIADGGNSITVDAAELTAIQAAVEILDDWDETNRAAVNLIASQTGIAGGTGTDAANVPRVTLATDVALPAGTNAIGKLAANSGVDIGDVDVTSISAGSNLIGDVGIQGRTTGGLSIYYDNDLDETAVAVKGSAGTLYSLHAINLTAAPLYLQLFDVAQGSVTVGTTTPTVQFVIPANADSDGAGFTLSIPQGIAFSTAITAAASTGSETNGAPSANACHVNLFYK